MVENIPGILISDDKVTVFGKGSPIIYINNRKINDERELQRLQSTDISTVELINNPGAKYDAEGRAVLIIKTKEKAMNGLSVQVSEELRKAGSWYDSEYVGLSYNLNNLSLFSSYSHGRERAKHVKRLLILFLLIPYGNNRLILRTSFSTITISLPQDLTGQSLQNMLWEPSIKATLVPKSHLFLEKPVSCPMEYLTTT